MKLKILTILTASVLSAVNLFGQTVVYSLPSTTIHLTVEAVRSSYTPGPYAGYAKKYLGIDVPLEESVTYTLSNIRLTPCLEADRSRSYVLNLGGAGKKASPMPFMQFTSQGLVILSNDDNVNGSTWRFPSMASGDSDMLASRATGNLTSAETVLYRTERNDNGEFERVAYKQSQVVEKSMEKKAQEAASMILNLRQNRINIITGNTDATFSGDALRAAIEETSRIEEDLMRLFTGSTSCSVQTMDFDVVPDSSSTEEMVIAFRLSDTQGLLPSDDISGRPVVIEIAPEAEQPETELILPETTQNSRRSGYYGALEKEVVHYRIPAICTVRITDGQELLLQSRIPVYQKGQELTFPVNLLIK